MHPDIVLGCYVKQKSKLQSQFLFRYRFFTDVSGMEVQTFGNAFVDGVKISFYPDEHIVEKSRRKKAWWIKRWFSSSFRDVILQF